MPKLSVVLGGGVALRATLCAALPSLATLLESRTELITPLLSWHRLKEGHYLATALSSNPYDGAAQGSFHAPPLLLALVGPLTAKDVPQWASYALWIAADVGTAWALAQVAERRRGRRLMEGESKTSGWKVAAFYLFHPFTLATLLARSSISFCNLFLVLSISAAVSGSLLTAVAFLSLATHFSLYPVLLLPALLLLVHQHQYPEPPLTPTEKAVGETKERKSLRRTAVKGTAVFVLHQAGLFAFSRWLTGGWDWVGGAYGVILIIPDLTPNISLSWYFFIEQFDHFRSFFLAVSALHPVIYVAPLTYYYRNDPLFAVTLLTGATALLKSYPALGDWSLWQVMALGWFSELGPYVHSPLFHVLLPLHALLLLPTFHHLWLTSGSGNANFFYASTLVWAVGMGGWIVEALKAYGRRETVRGLSVEGRGKVRVGEWEVVQR